MREILNPGRTCGTCHLFDPPYWDPIWGACMAPCFGGDPPDPEYPDSPDAETCIFYEFDERRSEHGRNRGGTVSAGDSFLIDGDLIGIGMSGTSDVITIELEVRRLHGFLDPDSTHVYGVSGEPIEPGRWVRVTIEDMGSGRPGTKLGD